MKLAAILLLLAFSLAACASEEAELTQPEDENASEEGEEDSTVPSQNQNVPEAEETSQPSQNQNTLGEIKEVVLTQSERGNLVLANETIMILLGSTDGKNPAYADPEVLSRLHSPFTVRAESIHGAIYFNQSGWIHITTFVFISEHIDSAIESAARYNVWEDSREIFLHKGNTIVEVYGNQISPVSVADIAKKLSRRLNMDIPGLRSGECTLRSASFRCISFSDSSGVNLQFENVAGRAVIVREVKTNSDAMKGSYCTTGEIDERLPISTTATFALDKSSTGSPCQSEDVGKEKNLYDISVTFSWEDSLSIKHRIEGRASPS